METKCDVLVVGAGLAGLTAARELHKKAPHLKVVVLEAKDRVGGRTLTVNLKTANGTDQWDLGGQWVGSTQIHLLNLLKELNIEYYTQYVTGKKLSQIGGTKIRPYSTTLPTAQELRDYSIWEGVDFLMALSRLESMAAKLNPNDVFALPEAARWDGMTLDEWARQNCHTRTMIDSLNLASKCAMGTESKRLNLLFMLYYGRSAGTISDLLEAEGMGAQRYRIKGGSQQLSRMMSDDLGDIVHLQTAVTKIEETAGGLRVLTTSTDGSDKQTVFRCMRIILAVPPSEAGKVNFIPPLPYHKRQLFDGAPQGNLIKFVFTYETAFWREKGYSGEILSTGYTEIPGEILPLCLTYDAVTNHGSAALLGFVHNEQWADRSKEERKIALLKDLARFFGDQCYTYIDYEDKNWHTEPYNGGCPVSCLPAGNMEYFMRIREPVDRIHFAGTESATLWPGYMSGAVQSGLRAAHEVLWNLHPKTVDRKLLEGSVYEQDYHQPQGPVGLSYQSTSSSLAIGKRLLLVSGVAAGLYALSKRYELPFITRVTQHLEEVVYSLYERFHR